MRLLLVLCFSLAAYAASGQEIKHLVIYFDFNQATPSQASQKLLDELLLKMKEQKPLSIIIKGHTDQAGTNEYNLKLSAQRARKVMQQIRTVVPDAAMNLEFFGEEQPLTMDELVQARNRRVELMVTFPPAIPVTVLEPFNEDVEEQVFIIDLEHGTTITGKGGTTIKIPAKAILQKDGKRMKGTAELRLKEYYSHADMLLSGTHTLSSQGLLQTGGMFKIFIVQGKDTASSKTNRGIEVRMPVTDPEMKDMQVFNMERDSATWRTSGTPFLISTGRWKWPHLSYLFPYEYYGYKFHYWPIGRKRTEEHKISRPLFSLSGKQYLHKHVKYVFKRTDSATVSVHQMVKFRRSGFKKYGVRNVDTSYQLHLQEPEYYAITTAIHFINCDRFLKMPQTEELMVSTPGYQGMNMMLYFKSINSFLPPNSLNGFAKIPPGLTAYVVAFGKKDGNHFFALKEVVTGKDVTAELQVEQVEKSEIEKHLSALAMR